MKKFLVTLIMFFVGVLVVNASPVYEIYTDTSNGSVRWEYTYDNAKPSDGLSIAFFDNANNVSSVVVPTFNTIKSSNPSISSSITTYKLVDYFEIPGRTRGSIVTPITSIDLSNVQIIEGIVPMLNTSVVTTVKFASSGTVITGTDVFRGGKLTLINLDKVEEIGPGAFFSAALTDTDIKLPSLELIGSDAFRESNVSTVEINTEIIADNAFRDCTNLTKVVLGDRVTELSHGSFQDDGNLSNINFNNVRTLGNYTFSGCTLFNIDISDTKLISIGDAAFMDTISYFGKLTIPVGVTSLGWRTFYNSAIDTVDMRNVETIGSETFSECKNLVRIDFGKVKTIDYRAFYNDKKVTNVSFSDSVFFVGTQAFSDCSINTLNLNKVERVSYEAFARNKLTELYLPKYFTFQMDSNLFTENQITKVTVAYDTLSSNNTINFRTMLGSNYTTLTDLVLEAPYGKDEEAVVSNHFGGVHRDYSYMNYSSFAGLDINYVRANNFKNILRHGYFYGLPSLVNVKVKEGYEFLGSESFFIEGAYSGGGDRSNYKLTNVELPDGLKGLGSGIFSGTLVNENVRINLPDSLEYIGYQSFFYCIGVTNSVDLPNLKYLQTHAFQYSGISKMYFRDKLVSVGEQTIFKCPNLKTIVFDVDIYAISPQNDHNFFSHIWMDHVYDLVEFTEKVQAEPAGADYEYSPGATFLYRLRAKKLIFHPDIPWKTLGKSFLQEAKVDYITLPQHLEKISSTAFYKADINSGNVVQIPDTITYIGDDAFHDAKIKINQLPANLQRIGRAAFYNCDFHSDPVIPESVTKIGGSSFMSDPGKGIHRNSFTINANIPASVTENNTVRQLMFNTAVDHLYFGPKVVELPSLTTRDTEFYQMPIKTATFEGLEVLPSKAFQECKDLVTVDFSKDENLNKISSLSFYKTESLEQVKLYGNDNTITLGDSAFLESGLKSIGKPDSGFDLTSNKFIAEGSYTFGRNPRLKYAYIPNDYNNNIVNEYMLWECRNLEMVDIDYQINKILPYAFAGDEKLKKLFLWGDTEVDDGTPISGTSSSTKNIKIINRATRDFELSIKDSIKGDSKIKNTDFALEDERLVYNYSKNRASVTDFELPYYVSIMIVESVMVSGTETNYMEIYIDDLDPSMFTIPSNTDIYTYSVYEVSSWDEDHELYRRNELLGTNSKYFPLDEVLYLTSNKPKIYLKEGSKDFDKSDLIVYALRRDGIILESDDWKEYTKHFARADNNITFERYNTQTNKDEEMVFDTYLPIALVDVSTENFESMTYSIDKRTSEIILNYVDKVTESDVDTDLNPTTDVNNAFTGASISIAIIAVLLILGIILVVISKKNKKIFSI